MFGALPKTDVARVLGRQVFSETKELLAIFTTISKKTKARIIPPL